MSVVIPPAVCQRKSENDAPNLRNLWFESPLGREGQQAVESEAQVGDFLGWGDAHLRWLELDVATPQLLYRGAPKLAD